MKATKQKANTDLSANRLKGVYNLPTLLENVHCDSLTGVNLTTLSDLSITNTPPPSPNGSSSTYMYMYYAYGRKVW